MTPQLPQACAHTHLPAPTRRLWLQQASALLVAGTLPARTWAQAAQAQKVVSLNGSLTGDLLALGAPLLATTARLPGASRHPRTKLPVVWRSALAKLPHPPQVLADTPSDADLAALQPDLIVLDSRQPGFSPERLKALAAIAPLLDVAQDFDTWQARLDFVAQALGRQQQAQAWQADYQSALQAFRQNAKMPEGASWDVFQMSAQDPAGDPFALSPQSPLGRLLADAGFTLQDTAAKVPGTPKPDALGRVPLPLAQLKQVFTAPWGLLIDNGAQISGQVCCTPAWQEVPTITQYHRFELQEFYLRPDAISAPHLLSTLQEMMAARG